MCRLPDGLINIYSADLTARFRRKFRDPTQSRASLRRASSGTTVIFRHLIPRRRDAINLRAFFRAPDDDRIFNQG